MQNIIFAWRQDFELSRFQNRHRCYSNQMWNLSSTNLASFMKTFSLFDEFSCHRRIFFSSSHESLASISHLLFEQFIDFYHDLFAQIWCLTIFTLVTRHEHRRVIWHHSQHSLITSSRTRHDRSSLSRALVTIAHRHSTYSSRSFIASRSIRRDHSSSLEIFTHDHSSSFDAFLTITHCHSTHSSRSLIASRSIRHDRSLSFETFIYDYSMLSTSARHQLKLWRINSSKFAQILKRKYCHDFKR